MGLLKHPGGSIAVVGGQVVEDDHGPWFRFGDQNLFDAAIEGIPIQGSGDHPGCHGPIAGQACDQGPVAPSPKRRAAFEPFTTWTAPVFAGHPGVGARLIQKDQPLRLPAHGLLSKAPVMPCFSNLWLAALPGDQAFFIYVAMATQQRVDTACRAPHVMGCQKGGPQFNQSDVGVLPDQLREERDKRFRFAAPLARHRRQGLKKRAIPDLIAPASRRRGAQQKHLARRRSAQPPVHQIPEPDPKGHRKRIPHGTSCHTG